MRRPALTLLVLLAMFVAASIANADDGIKVGWYSQQLRPNRAVIGAHIDQSGRTYAASSRTSAAQSSRRTESRPPLYPVIASTAPMLRDPQPFGPDSFWYTDGIGHRCMYAPGSVLPCYTVVAPRSARTSPAAIAASIARRIPLAAGQIHASPSRSGLTGAPAWFWLDPAPRRVELSVSLAGETVRVVADPEVEWRFGDGMRLRGGAGIPYRPGAAPVEAIRHVYETRCLAGDQGRNPYVLASCGQDGYSVEAVVVWRISFEAAGPVVASGTLPSRTTEASSVYPVSESRAFLVSGVGR